MNELQKQLFTLQDPSYLDFHSKLIPTIEQNHRHPHPCTALVCQRF